MIDRWLEGKEVCVCAGPGGVGKTSTAAAIALGMAARGGKVAVLTIDPARRLAHALGLDELGHEAHLVDAPVKGELWAMMLDPKRTFDDLVEQHAPDERTRDSVLANPIYRELSNAVAGSQEYMAMEKLHELHREGRYDLLVLDTPPTRNALDFLDAPRKLAAFIDSPSLQLLAGPGRPGAEAARPRHRRALRRDEARHRRGPARRPVRVLPQLRRDGGGLPRARRGGQRAAGRRAQHVRAGHLPARRTRSTRRSSSTSACARPSCPSPGVVANRVRTPVPAHRADLAAEVEDAARPAAGAQGGCAPGTRSACWPSATAPR